MFTGVGVGMLVISSIGGIFYPMLMAWSLYYMFASWQSPVPWSDCRNSFNTPSTCQACNAHTHTHTHTRARARARTVYANSLKVYGQCMRWNEFESVGRGHRSAP